MRDQRENIRMVISGGGTGGHLFPALAIADKMRDRHPDAEILFVGARGKIEMEKVPRAGYKITGLWISGLHRGELIRNLTLPFKLVSSLLKSSQVLRSFRPHVAVGTGGYASAPLLFTANRRGIPTLIQEQNYYPGLANRQLSRHARTICVIHKSLVRYFDASKLVVTGNPVRGNILDAPSRVEACRKMELDPKRPVLLVTGGSLGAGSINQAISAGVEDLSESSIQVLWQTGKYDHETYLEKMRGKKLRDVKIMPFIEDMALAYAAADVVVCRAGAITLAELAVMGKPVILVPSPNVAEDHQTKNAKALEGEDAAIMIGDADAKEKLVPAILQLIGDESRKKMLAQQIKAAGHPDATDRIVDEVEKLLPPELTEPKT